MAPGTGFFMKFPTFPDSPYVAKYDFLSDTGRATVTRNDADKNIWRVPGLRNLVYTAPYFHNGQVHTIDEAVLIMASTQLNKELTDAQVADIVAFLETLTGPFPAQEMPRLPPTPGDLID
jgi:cytochrome c peroxidase